MNRERDDARDCIELFVHYGELIQARNNGRYAEARAMAKLLISERPEMADIYRLLGDTATQKGKDKAAISHFRLYFALAEAQRGASESDAGERPVDHRMIGARLNLGIAYSRLGHYDESLEQFDLALGEAPELAAGHYYRGSTLLNLDQPEEALAEFRRALELDPDHALSAQQLEVLGFGSQCASAGRANGSEQCSTD